MGNSINYNFQNIVKSNISLINLQYQRRIQFLTSKIKLYQSINHFSFETSALNSLLLWLSAFTSIYPLWNEDILFPSIQFSLFQSIFYSFVSLVKKTTPPILSYPRFRVQFNTYIIHLSKTSTDNQFMYLKADSLFL